MSAGEAWWRRAVTYQVYVRSFADGDGDGIGDLQGVRSRLDHLSDLGIDAIWLNPFYPSPQVDAGYDVADHCDVDPVFGTLADFDALLADAHGRGMRVIVDLVPNHTSSAHPWFRAALAAAPGSEERARYLFRPGSGPSGDAPPNDWLSVFGGPAWTRVDDGGSPGQWYLHLFDAEQPDLDWTNPQVRAEFERILRFWLDRGVDGFRIDVAHGLAKDPDMPDLAGRYPTGGPAAAGHPHWDQDEVHDVYRSWRRLLAAYPGERAFVAEAWVDGVDRLARYLRGDELHTAFNFSFLLSPFEPGALRTVVDETIAALGAVGAPPTWVLSNHDVVRVTTRLGGGESGVRRARAAALLMLALPGGAYIYQGEELGLPEVVDLDDDVRQDPTFARTGGLEAGRDGCRVPMPWAGTAPPFGFSPTGRSWLPQPPDWAALTAEAQRGERSSTLAVYRAALDARRRLPGPAGTDLAWVDAGPTALAFTRHPGFACVVNLADEDLPLPAELAGGEVIVASADGCDAAVVAPWAAAWYSLP